MSVKKRVNLLEHLSNTVNCFFKDGALIPGYDPTFIAFNPLSSRVIFAVYSKAAKLYFLGIDKRVYKSPELYAYTTFLTYDNSAPFLIEDLFEGVERAVIIIGKTASVCVNNEKIDVTLKVELECGVMHCGRLFGANGLDIWWSGPGGFSDWGDGTDGCGRLTLGADRGKVLDMVEYDGKVVVVREYGLTVLSMFGSPEKFSVDFTDTDCDKIYKRTARVVGGKLYFFTESGLKCFDGSKISSLKIRHEVVEPWSSAEYGGRYFLACKSEVLGRDVILCVDSKDGESCIINDHADVVYAKDGICYFNERLHNALNKGGWYKFECDIDFGTGRDKTVTKIEFDGLPYVAVNNGKFTRSLYPPKRVVRPRIRGKRFLLTAEECKPMRWAFATAEVVDDV